MKIAKRTLRSARFCEARQFKVSSSRFEVVQKYETKPIDSPPHFTPGGLKSALQGKLRNEATGSRKVEPRMKQDQTLMRMFESAFRKWNQVLTTFLPNEPIARRAGSKFRLQGSTFSEITKRSQ